MYEKNDVELIDIDYIEKYEISDFEKIPKDPIISVLMLTYNHDKFVSQAIEGIINQKTIYSFELVIGEDCSTDVTRQIVLDYQKKYPHIIRVITSDKNVGIVRNNIRTENSCRGKYIALCEGDDYWFDFTKIQKQVTFMEDNPDVGLIHSDVDQLINDTGVVIRNFNKTNGVDYSFCFDVFTAILVGQYSIHTCSVCAKRKLFVDAIRDVDLAREAETNMGDLQRWLYIAKNSKIHYINESYAVRRVLTDSASFISDKIKRLKFNEWSRKIRFHFAEKYRDDITKECHTIVQLNLYEIQLYKSYLFTDKTLAVHSIKNIYRVKNRATIRHLILFIGGYSRLAKLFIKPVVFVAKKFTNSINLT